MDLFEDYVDAAGQWAERKKKEIFKKNFIENRINYENTCNNDNFDCISDSLEPRFTDDEFGVGLRLMLRWEFCDRWAVADFLPNKMDWKRKKK